MLKKTSLVIKALILVYLPLLIPSVRVANDLHFAFKEEAVSRFSLPFVWGASGAVGMGEYAVSVLWNWPLGLVFGLFGKLGIPFEILLILFGFIPFLIFTIFGFAKLCDYLKISKYGKFVGTFFFLTNTYILLLIDGGQLNLAIAYSLLPVAFVYLKKAIEEPYLLNMLKGALVTFLLSVYDIRVVYLLILIIGVDWLFNLRKFINYFITGLVTGIVLIGLHFYWILPSILVRAPALPQTYGRVSQTEFLSFGNWKHSVLLLQPHWYKNVFGKVTGILPEFVLIPILVFLAPVLRKKNKSVAFWLVVALVSVFLAKGTSPPLAQVYPWLFNNVPGFSLFRDPTKFFFLVALSYSILIGVTVDELINRIRWKINFLGKNVFIIPLLLTIYCLLLINPVWLGKMTGTFSEPIYKEQYFSIAKILEEDKGFGRVFWIPTKAPLGYSSPTHPSVEALRLVQKRPFAIGVVGTYEIFNFLREAPFMGEIFNVAGIKYIAYPFPDTRREELKPDNIEYYNVFLDQLSNLPWIEKRLTRSPIALLKTKGVNSHFFLTENTFCVVGPDSIYQDLVKIPGFGLSKNAITFMEENAGLGNILRDTPCRYILYDKGPTDFAATFIDQSRFILPAVQLNFDPNPSTGPSATSPSVLSSGHRLRGRSDSRRSKDSGPSGSGSSSWWKRETADLIWWRNFLHEKYGIENLDFDYGGGWAVAEGETSYQLSAISYQLNKGDILLARAMESGRGGKISFYQGDSLVGEINTLKRYTTATDFDGKVTLKLTGYGGISDKFFDYNKADLRWFEVGQLVDNSRSLEIRADGDINVVNVLAAVSKDEWTHINELIHKYKIVDWNKLSQKDKVKFFEPQSNQNVSYIRISPTHYRVKVEGLTKPSTLAFSETYDSLWRISEGESKAGVQDSYPLYSLINGFLVEKDGEYDITFEAQKYVLPGLVVSATTILVLLSCIIFLRWKS